MRQFFLIPLIVCVGLSAPGDCDTFTIREDDGNTVSIDARMLGEGLGAVALERTDGRIEVVPRTQVLKREVGKDPVPINCATMIERLTTMFGAEKFRAQAEDPFVVGLILSEPLSKSHEKNAADCLSKAVAFMKTVEKVFLDFTNDLKIETESPAYPLVLLIFETDDDFIRYAQEETGGKGLSAGSMLGYYSSLTNRLVIRMSECRTFATPLHEAVHQQVYNRGLIQRLSPVPVWFHEGIATGFEGNNEKINGGPLKVSVRYGRMAMNAKAVSWDDVVSDDKAFRGDVSASEAYGHAWSIHWFLITKYRKQYINYLGLLGQKQPLQFDNAQVRIRDFEQMFGKPVGQLQQEFPRWLEQAAKKQKISLADNSKPGHLLTQSNLAEVEMTASIDGSIDVTVAEGRMRNISLIRPMSFVVTLETTAGTYAEWYLPSVAPSKVVPLPRQFLRKLMKGAPGGRAEKFHVKVKAVVPESETGKAWQQGQFPIPVWTDR